MLVVMELEAAPEPLQARPRPFTAWDLPKTTSGSERPLLALL